MPIFNQKVLIDSPKSYLLTKPMPNFPTIFKLLDLIQVLHNFLSAFAGAIINPGQTNPRQTVTRHNKPKT